MAPRKTTKPRVCKECIEEGVTALKPRPAPHVGPRCVSHHRARRKLLRSSTQEQRWMAVYGISGDEYRKVKAFQGGVCAICQKATGEARALAVDHDHSTGIVRGCLCKRDNVLLGHARDQIEFFERCIEYLKNPPAVQVLGERIVPDMRSDDLTSNAR